MALHPGIFHFKWATSIGKEAKSKMKHVQICPRRDSNSGGSDLWPNALPTRPQRRPCLLDKYHENNGYGFYTNICRDEKSYCW